MADLLEHDTPTPNVERGAATDHRPCRGGEVADLMHGTGGGPEVLWVLLWSAGLVAVFAPLTMRSYNAER